MKRLDYVVKTEAGDVYIENHTRELSDDIVDQLIEIRKTKGMSQQDVADVSGLPRANISRIERKLYTPTIAVLSKYALGMGKKIRLEIDDI